MEKEFEVFEIAPFPRRIGAWFIDFLIIFIIWYLATTKDMDKINKLMENLDPEIEGNLEIFIKEVFKLYTIFILKLLFVKTMYYSIVPGIIGRGKTLGKLIFSISMVKRDDLSEISPSRLILREFIGQGLIETILFIPIIISFIFLFSKESRTIHDRLAKTVVIKDTSFIGE